MVITVGGTIPADDIPELKKLGVAEVFTPGASTDEIVEFVRGAVAERIASSSRCSRPPYLALVDADHLHGDALALGTFAVHEHPPPSSGTRPRSRLSKGGGS